MLSEDAYKRLIDKISKAGDGNWKKEIHIRSCLCWVVDNFDEVEPILKSLYLEKEMKKQKEEDKER